MNSVHVIIDSINSGYVGVILSGIVLITFFSSITTITMKNPIISVLCLIMLFTTVAAYLLFSNLTFLGLAYILVYVGAISILFLFILMLIDIRVSELVSDTKNSIPLILIILIICNASNVLFPYNTYYLSELFLSMKSVWQLAYKNWEDALIAFNNIISIGNIMYSDFAIFLFIVSFILLLAMIGAIVITVSQPFFEVKSTGNMIRVNPTKPHGFIFLSLECSLKEKLKNLNTKKILNILIRIFIIFIVGLILKYFIDVIYHINVVKDYLNPISIIYYFIMAILKVFIVFLSIDNAILINIDDTDLPQLKNKSTNKSINNTILKSTPNKDIPTGETQSNESEWETQSDESESESESESEDCDDSDLNRATQALGGVNLDQDTSDLLEKKAAQRKASTKTADAEYYRDSKNKIDRLTAKENDKWADLYHTGHKQIHKIAIKDTPNISDAVGESSELSKWHYEVTYGTKDVDPNIKSEVQKINKIVTDDENEPFYAEDTNKKPWGGGSG